MNNLKKTYPAYDDWLSENMVELKKAVDHLPMEETSDIIEVAGRLIWLAAQQQEGYVMVPVEPTDEMWSNGIDAYSDAMSENKILKASSIVDVYKAMIQAAQE